MLEIEDPKLQSSNFMKFIEKVHTGEYSFEGNTLVTKLPQQQAGQKKVSWEDEYKEFQQYIKDNHEDYDEYEEMWGEEGSWSNQYIKSPKEYDFSETNPFAQLQDPYQKGLEFMDNGRIKDAILAFEGKSALYCS